MIERDGDDREWRGTCYTSDVGRSSLLFMVRPERGHLNPAVEQLLPTWNWQLGLPCSKGYR
jgi:hypothetical protein